MILNMSCKNLKLSIGKKKNYSFLKSGSISLRRSSEECVKFLLNCIKSVNIVFAIVNRLILDCIKSVNIVFTIVNI